MQAGMMISLKQSVYINDTNQMHEKELIIKETTYQSWEHIVFELPTKEIHKKIT